MAGTDKKKKSPIVFFFAALLAIVVVMFIANRESVLVERVRFPFNNGVVKLSTDKNFLVAVCLDNKVYVWDWDNLPEKPQIGLAQSHQAVLMKSDMVVSLREQSPKALIVTDLKGDKKHKDIPIASYDGRAYLGVSRDRSAVALLVEGKTSYKISIVDPDEGKIEPVVTMAGEAAESRVGDLAVSDDGALVVLFGEKDGCGWLILVNLKQRRVVWEKQVPELRLFFDAVFSPDSEVVYARGSDSTLYKIETASGKILDRLLPLKKNKSTLTHSSTQTVAVSPDGQLVAAIVSSTFYVWDRNTGKKIFGKTPGHKIESGLAFSPDSRFLATSDLRQGGTINIWRLPGR